MTATSLTAKEYFSVGFGVLIVARLLMYNVTQNVRSPPTFQGVSYSLRWLTGGLLLGFLIELEGWGHMFFRKVGGIRLQ
jgi:hypothetical protein